MLPDGQYSAWFRTPRQEGMGIITLAAGQLTGRDVAIAYHGSYVQHGDHFTATIATRRHSDAASAIFGIDEVDIDVSGTSRTDTASCTGRARQRPDVPFEVILVRIKD